MKLYKYKAIVSKAIGCLFLSVLTGAFNISVAQVVAIESNEKKVVECTPVKTKRDIALEQRQQIEVQTQQAKEQGKEEKVSEGDKSQDTQVVEWKELKAAEAEMMDKELRTAEAEEYNLKVVQKTEVTDKKKTEVIDDK